MGKASARCPARRGSPLAAAACRPPCPRPCLLALLTFPDPRTIPFDQGVVPQPHRACSRGQGHGQPGAADEEGGLRAADALVPRARRGERAEGRSHRRHHSQGTVHWWVHAERDEVGPPIPQVSRQALAGRPCQAPPFSLYKRRRCPPLSCALPCSVPSPPKPLPAPLSRSSSLARSSTTSAVQIICDYLFTEYPPEPPGEEELQELAQQEVALKAAAVGALYAQHAAGGRCAECQGAGAGCGRRNSSLQRVLCTGQT